MDELAIPEFDPCYEAPSSQELAVPPELLDYLASLRDCCHEPALAVCDCGNRFVECRQCGRVACYWCSNQASAEPIQREER